MHHVPGQLIKYIVVLSNSMLAELREREKERSNLKSTRDSLFACVPSSASTLIRFSSCLACPAVQRDGQGDKLNGFKDRQSRHEVGRQQTLYQELLSIPQTHITTMFRTSFLSLFKQAYCHTVTVKR